MAEITIADLLKGKSTMIKTKEYSETKRYVEPFLERMSAFTNDFRIKVKTPDQMTTNANSMADLTFNRVLIEAVLPEKYTIDGHDEVVGFLYGIDIKKPAVKMYRSYLNQACTNMCVFNPEWLNIQDLIPGEPINFKPVKDLMEYTSDFPLKLKALKDTYLSRDMQTQYLGDWVDYSLREHEDFGYGKVKIAVSTPVDAYKKLFVDSSSDYYVPLGIDPTLFDVYNAFTQVLTDDSKDLMNKFEKVMLINKLLKV